MYSLKEEKISQITPFSVLADNKRIRNKIIDGKSTQATRSGKNLYNNADIVATSNASIIKSLTGFTATRTSNSTGDLFVASYEKQLKPNTTYTFYENRTNSSTCYFYSDNLFGTALIRNIVKSTDTLVIYTFTTDSTGKVVIGFYSVNQTQGNTVTLSNIMILEGKYSFENIPVYEPYGASPSPEFPSEIKSVGDDVNLFDYTDIQNWNDWSGFRNGKIKYFNLEPNTQYILSSNVPLGNSCLIYFNGTSTRVNGVYNNHPIIQTSNSNGELYIGTFTNRDYYSDIISGKYYIKLQKGDKATPYSEYGKGTVTIEQRGKNLGKNNIVSGQKGGLTITKYDDDTFRVQGTTTGDVYIFGSENNIDLEAGTYILSGCPTGGSSQRYDLFLDGVNGTNDYGNERTFSITEHISSNYVLRIRSGQTVDFIVKPMLRFATIQDNTYEPYFSKDYVIQTTPLRSLPNGTKDTIEEDGIHRRVRHLSLAVSDMNGSENYPGWSNLSQLKEDLGSNYNTPVFPVSLRCNILKDNTYLGLNTKASGSLFLNKSAFNLTQTEWKEQYPNLVVEIDYELSEEVVEPFTDEQLDVLNSMKTFEGVNYFSLAGDLQTTLTFDYNPKITEEIKRAFKYNITKAYLEVAATDKDSGFQINEDNYLQSIDFDDCRYIEGEGIIGSCVAKELQGKFVNVDTSFDIENREIECFIGAETEDNITHYLRLGTFIVQKPENDNVKDNTSFDSLDYMIKFNKEYVHRMSKYLKTKDTDIIQDKQYYILTESGAYEEVIVPHKEEISNYYELIDEYTLMQLLKDICEQCEVKLGTFDFRNANYVVHGNRFDTGTTCRDVLKAIAQAAFSWARINEYNELLLDFETSDTITEEIDYNEYYNLSFNDKYGPVNTIVLKNSQAEGENITVQDETLVKNYGIKELAISDNPFAYSEETRKAIIEAGKMLYGFTYVPLTVETIGAAYLNCKDKIKVKNMQDGDLETYLFNTRISYQGTIKSNVETLAMTDTETKYRYDGSLTTAQRRTEFKVDKAEQKITSLVKATTEQGEKLTEATQDLDEFKRTIIDKTDKTNEKITTIEETVNGLVTEKSVSGGQNLVKNSVGYFGNDYWQINEETEGTVLSENSTDVKQNSISGSALKLQAETIYQDIKEIKNGEYYLSFNYKRIINTAIATLKVNNLIINLTEENWKEEAHLINVTTNNIRIEITTDLNSSILITDLMLTEGNLQVSWTQNTNESYTDTVQIGKGVRITATGSDTEFVAEATGITINNTETGGKVAEFTKYGTETQELVAHKDVKVADSLLIQKIGNQTWFSSL